jgi:hypothetical protein
MSSHQLNSLKREWSSGQLGGLMALLGRGLYAQIAKHTYPIRRSVSDLRFAHSARGWTGVARYCGDQIRFLGLRTLERGQSEEELARVAQDYWNEGDKAGIDLKDYSHWEGAGPWKDRDRWRAIGRVHFEMFKKLCVYASVPRPLGKAIEWGCGGGANAIHFVDDVREFCGVEISQANLDECGRVLARAGFRGFRPVLVPSENPEQVRTLLDASYDFFLCTYVYETLPGQHYCERVTRLAYELLAPSGLALIQIRYDEGSIRSKQRRFDYFRYAARFTSFQIEEFWELAERIGFRPLYVSLVPRKSYEYSGDLYAYFALMKPASDGKKDES